MTTVKVNSAKVLPRKKSY